MDSEFNKFMRILCYIGMTLAGLFVAFMIFGKFSIIVLKIFGIYH